MKQKFQVIVCAFCAGLWSVLAVAGDSGTCTVSGKLVNVAADSIVIQSQNERFHFQIPAALRETKLNVGDQVTVSVPLEEGVVVRTLRKQSAGEQAPGVVPSSKPILDDRIFYPA